MIMSDIHSRPGPENAPPVLPAQRGDNQRAAAYMPPLRITDEVTVDLDAGEEVPAGCMPVDAVAGGERQGVGVTVTRDGQELFSSPGPGEELRFGEHYVVGDPVEVDARELFPSPGLLGPEGLDEAERDSGWWGTRRRTYAELEQLLSVVRCGVCGDQYPCGREDGGAPYIPVDGGQAPELTVPPLLSAVEPLVVGDDDLLIFQQVVRGERVDERVEESVSVEAVGDAVRSWITGWADAVTALDVSAADGAACVAMYRREVAALRALAAGAPVDPDAVGVAGAGLGSWAENELTRDLRDRLKTVDRQLAERVYADGAEPAVAGECAGDDVEAVAAEPVVSTPARGRRAGRTTPPRAPRRARSKTAARPDVDVPAGEVVARSASGGGDEDLSAAAPGDQGADEREVA